MTPSSTYEPVAIISAGCRFPGGGNSPDAYWRVLTSGEHTTIEVPAERWDFKEYYDPDPDAPGKTYTSYGCFIEHAKSFDAQFFEMSPREASSLDPQQRLLLEVTWETLENANLTPVQLASKHTGVFVGISTFDYSNMVVDELPAEDIDAYYGTGNSHSTAAGRLSYFLRLTGPTMAVDTACSSSLVALHLAARSLQLGECNVALVGGVNLQLSVMLPIAFSKARMLAPDGRSKAFDRAADGYVRGEGCGMLLLKRLDDALADGDHILAVVRGSAVNHDGRTSGIAVPSQQAQEAVIREALQAAGLNPADINYVEAHGTGTAVGDPLEAAALASVFGPERAVDKPLYISSAKTNIGHLEAASGMAGLVKVLLALQHGEIPPHLHFEELNPLINWDGLPFEIPTKRQPWQSESRRLVGINNFGFSGTNAHIILEEFVSEAQPPATESEFERPLHLLTLSAKSEHSLLELGASYAEYFTGTQQQAGDIGFSANTGRSHFDRRLALTAASTEEMAQKLAKFTTGENVPNLKVGQGGGKPRVAFLFNGQGPQHVGMGRELYETAPRFRQTLDYCADFLADYLDIPLLELLYPDNPGPEAQQRLMQTKYTQPAMFALDYALADLWRSWGIVPDIICGHSIGEYPAACLGGAIDLDDCLRLVAARGPMIQELPLDGGMMAVMASAEAVEDILAPYSGDVSIGAYNSPANIVLSGLKDALHEIAAVLEEQEIQAQMLDVSHAFHTHLMDPALPALREMYDGVVMRESCIPLVSCVDGTLAGADIATADYWVKQARQPVRFMDVIETLHSMDCDVLIEIGPQPSLLSMARSTISPKTGRDMAFLPSLRKKKSNWQTMLNALMTLYLRGKDIDWAGFDAPYTRQKVSLPNYSFDRKHYWFRDETKKPKGGHHYTPTAHPLLGEKLPIAGENIHIFQQKITTPGIFSDHRIFDIPMLPATGYLEIALAAGREVFKSTALVLSDVRFEQMLNLSNTPLLLQVIITRQPDSKAVSFEIFSRPDDEHTPWLRHASGQVAALEAEIETLPPVDFEVEVNTPAFTEQDVELYYRRLNYKGLTYGSAFRRMNGLWAVEENALGRMLLTQEQIDPDFVLHPALSDAALHPLAEAEGELMLPTGVERLAVWGRFSGTLWSRAEANMAGEKQSGNVYLFNAAGEHCASFEGLHAMPLDRNRLLRLLHGDVRRWAYKLVWKAQPLPVGELDYQGAPWLIFGSGDGIDADLQAHIKEQGGHCVLAMPGDSFQQIGEDRYSMNPASPEDFTHLLGTEDEWQGVIFLWAAAYNEPGDLDSLWQSQEVICGGALHLAQALAGMTNLPRFWLVTRGAQAINTDDVPQLAQAPLWGLGRVVMLEQPQLACVCLDLDQGQNTDNLSALVDALAAPAHENQIAYRNGQWHSARMTYSDQEPGQLVIPGESFQLKLAEYGLDNLYLSPIVRHKPAADEVEIRVQAAGLNFRDAITALGMMQEATAEYGIHEAADVPLGGECCGVVTAVGESVEHLQVNDDVLTGFAPGSLGSHVTVRADLVFPKPQGMNPQEAVTLPVAFLTAYYGLIRLANLQPGERVLIHAAAGGVGQAAVQLAQHSGADIFATASSGKWDFLREQGITHIFNSRTLDFSQQIIEVTGGQGVDVVLNSLTGDFVGASLDALGENGRFIEMGKIGIYSAEKMQTQRPDVSYTVFDLLEMAYDNPDLIREMYDTVQTMLQAEKIRSLTYRDFSIRSAPDAFQYMAQARHIGKVVVTLEENNDTMPTVSQPLVSPGVGYLITGGTGGLGFKVAEWLAEAGAEHLVLCSRSGKLAQENVDLLHSYGVQLHLMPVDVANPEDVTALFTRIEAELPPLRGVIHAAGVLDLDLLQNQRWEHFERTMRPKLAGGWNLHRATQALDLDFFVNFSSIVSLWGSPGQANYAAANAFLDALAAYRRTQGLPGLTINWGAWAEVGMAADQQETTAAAGLEMISPVMGLQALEWSLQQTELSQIALTPVNWPDFPMLGQALFENFSRARPGTGAHLRETLLILTAEERHEALLNTIRGQLVQILGLSSSDNVQPQHNLLDLGLDSLMGMELINQLETGLGQTIPPTAIFNYPTLDVFTAYLLALAFEDAPEMEINADLTGLTLDPTIVPPPESSIPASLQAAFVTGGTGFVGAYLLSELLKTTQATFYCLVRGTAENALARLQANLEQYALWEDTYQERLIAVPGNLAEERFGLTAEAFSALAEEVDAIYHVGAILDLVQPYQALKPVNVDGTQEVLRLAAETKLKPVHHVSTIGLFLTQTGEQQTVITEDDFPDVTTLYGGYVQTKWAAEQLVRQAQERGIPASIYRLGFIVGASDTGHTNLTDLISRLIKGSHQMRRVADWDIALNLVPVDYVGRAIAYLSLQPQNLNEVFHLTALKSTPVMDIVNWANQLGYDYRTIPYNEWRQAMLMQADNALLPLLPLFADQGLTYNVDRAFDCKHTLEKLQGSGVRPIPAEECFAVYYAYMLETGFMVPPEEV